MRRLRVLLIEDREDDATLVLAELGRGGFDVVSLRVETEHELLGALEQDPWDVVISDYTMPSFSCTAALEVLKKRGLDLPFVIVSGTISEDLAVKAMKAGAHDYVLKERLGRLSPVVDRELREAAKRVEQRQSQEKLLRTDRMASMGTLVAGVAHEINNPLSVIVANLDLLAISAESIARAMAGRDEALEADASELREIVEETREAALRVRSIVADLKTLSRADDREHGPVDVHKALDFSIKMAASEIRYRARLLKIYGPIVRVHGSEARLGQVFLNLLVNAAHAVPEGHADENEITVTTAMGKDGRVLVHIRDTGVGIPDDALRRIFDPFFTSKPVGVGTGLGLAICAGIVKAHDGDITVQSTVGVGTTFTVSLPRSPEDAPVSSREEPAPPPRCRGRVLVIDDEPAIGSALRRILQKEHDVEVTTSAGQALELLHGGRRFDAILCDLMMPGQTGMDLHEELERSMPEQAARMIFLTGGAVTARARDLLERMPSSHLEKPFDANVVRVLIARRMG